MWCQTYLRPQRESSWGFYCKCDLAEDNSGNVQKQKGIYWPLQNGQNPSTAHSSCPCRYGSNCSSGDRSGQRWLRLCHHQRTWEACSGWSFSSSPSKLVHGNSEALSYIIIVFYYFYSCNCHYRHHYHHLVYFRIQYIETY